MTDPTSLRATPVVGGGRQRAGVVVLLVVTAFIGLASAKPWDAGTPASSGALALLTSTATATTPSLPASAGSAAAIPSPARPIVEAFTLAAPPPAGAEWAGLTWTRLTPDDLLNLVGSVASWHGGFIALGWNGPVAMRPAPSVDVGLRVRLAVGC